MDATIKLFLIIVLFISIVSFFYGVIKGKLDETYIAGLFLIVVGILGLNLALASTEYLPAMIQTNYNFAKAYIEYLNTSESVKQTALLSIQQINESSQRSLYDLKNTYSMLFIGFIILGLILLIGKSLMPKESNETFRKEGA